MLAATPKAKRFLEVTQFILSFTSVCAVLEASRVQAEPADRPGYQTSIPEPREAARDRSIGDLARVERRRREAEQRSSRRGAELGSALEQRQLSA